MRSFKSLAIWGILILFVMSVQGCMSRHKYSILPGNRGSLNLKKRQHSNPQKGAIVVNGELASLIEIHTLENKKKIVSSKSESEVRKIRPVMTLKDGGKLPNGNAMTDARIYVRRLPRSEYSAWVKPFCNHPITGKLVDKFEPEWFDFTVDEKARDEIEKNTGRRYGWVLEVNNGDIPGNILDLLLEDEDYGKGSWFFKTKRKIIRSREGWQFFGEGDYSW